MEFPMSTVTYDAGHAAAAKAPVAAQAGKRKGCFARALARMIAARQQQAMDEVRRHGIVLPRELEQAEWKVSERSEDSLPFKR
jgi:hypothetical protein